MSQSMVFPLTIALQATAPVETTPRIEGEESGQGSGAAFALDADPAADPAAGPSLDSLPWTDVPPDPLQRLVEALSGISGALSERHGKGVAQDAEGGLPAEAPALPDGVVGDAAEGQAEGGRTADRAVPVPTDRLQAGAAPPGPARGANAAMIPGLPQPATRAFSATAPGSAAPADRPEDGAAPEAPGLGKADLAEPVPAGAPIRNARRLPADPLATQPHAAETQDPGKAALAERLPAGLPATEAGPISADPATRTRTETEAPDLAGPPARRATPVAGPLLGAQRPDGPARDILGLDTTALAEAFLADIPALDAGLTPVDPLTAQARMVEGAGLTDPRAGRALPVARQIAEALITARGDVVEIALAPEELGRLRMVVSGPDQAPHVTIWVERPEVLDQLRRNGAFLQECLGDAGMEQASFEFRGDTPPDSRDDRAEPAPESRAGFLASLPAQVVPLAWTPVAVSARLDIRI